MGKHYEHLTDSERRRIERLRAAGMSIRKIAERLDRGVSTVSEELKRNTVKGAYDAKKAAHKSRVRRKYSKVQSMTVVTHAGLRAYVEEKIAQDWSPEMVAGRIRTVDTHLPNISVKAVYKFVYSVYGRKLEPHLHHRRVKKKGGPKRGRQPLLDGRHSIEERPKHVDTRRQFGHFEGDFIVSGKDGHGSLLVLVERKTRYPFLAYLEHKTAREVNDLTARLLAGIPVRSLTLDNDVSFVRHAELSTLIGANIFFCHAYASCEKGTVENRNGRIRETIRKRSDLSQVSVDIIKGVEEKLRSLPMKCLNWKTPQEAWDAEMKKTAARADGRLMRALKVNERCSA